MDFSTIFALILAAIAVFLFIPWTRFKLPSLPQVPTVKESLTPDTDAEARKHFLALMECYLRAGDKAKAAALSAIETGGDV